jgi:hypothetical protein
MNDAKGGGGGTMSTLTLREKFLVGGVLTALVCVALTAQVTAQSVAAQQRASPPDFSLNQAGWVTVGGDLMPVPGGGPKPITFDPAHPYVPNNIGKQPTYRIADLSNPNLKPWVVERMRKDNAEVLAGKIAYTARSSCKPAGTPAFMLIGGAQPLFFVQTPKEVWMIYSGNAEVRRVYLDVPHSANPRPSWYGESVGHYDGDTLAIDTVGLNDKTFIDNYRTPHSEKLHVTERWRMIEGGNRMQVNIRIEDPDAFNEPWSAVQHYRRVQQVMFEEACAENNARLFDYHIPVADKPDF